MKQGLTMFYSYRLSQNPLESTKAMPHYRDAFHCQNKPRPLSPDQGDSGLLDS